MFSQAHQLLQWTAIFRQGTGPTDPEFETAVGSLRIAGPTAIEHGGQATCDALADILSAYWSSAGALIPSNCFLTTVKWNQIGRDGKYNEPGATIQHDFAGVPGARTAAYPTQISWATTWDTDQPRGRAARGRTYWPTGVAISPLFNTVGVTDAKNKANKDLALVNQITAVMSGSVPDSAWPAVMSNIGEGATHRITGTRVGVRLDVQRRRGKGVSENYQVGS